jgi:hypothetical protein
MYSPEKSFQFDPKALQDPYHRWIKKENASNQCPFYPGHNDDHHHDSMVGMVFLINEVHL